MTPSAGDRLRGFLWGAAVGDALGAAVNDLSADEIRRRFGTRMLRELVEVGGVHGRASQHSQLLLFCCESLIRAFVCADEKGIAPDFAAILDRGYARWLQTQGLDSPRHDSSEFDGWLRTERRMWHERRGASHMADAMLAPRPGSLEESVNASRGCGALPVVSAAGLITMLSREARYELAERLAALTHGHRDAQIAAGALAELIDRVRWGASLTTAADEVEQRTAIGTARRLAADGLHAGPVAIGQLGKGWTAPEALSIALFCALVAADFEDGVLAAVNHDGDSDACGAIAGQLLGTLLGVDAIPARWREQLELRRTVTAMTDDLTDWYGREDQRPADASVWARYPGW